MTDTFVKGADISIIHELEELGGKFYYQKKERDLFEILKINGINTIRLRIWVDPYDEEKNPYLGGTNDLRTTLDLAKRAKANGMQWMINFHYSDFWADPKKQMKPKAWDGLSGKQLEDEVYQYTRQVLEICAEQDVIPEFIQIGNEITNGMLWPDGKTPMFKFEERRFEDVEEEVREKSYNQLARLLKAGIRAVKEVRMPQSSKIILHLDFGGANELYRTWFDEITRRDVDFDIIGLSYYPFWHGSLDELEFNLNDISARYNKEVLIVETAYGFTEEDPLGSCIFTKDLADIGGYPATVEGQKSFLRDLMKIVQQTENHKGKGIVYWEPSWLPLKNTTWASYEGMKYGNDVAPTGNHWANQGLFDFKGNTLDSLNVFREF
ncbi:glycoside hydrolase family 53 protein [Bacillus sp. SD088]|uniref:glycoside hydrolase family 53 protein n=1 Tax=Bacillus sp. SD088 TaxID=2782012 RepID=UPI0028BDCD15|nr:glycosyl hydrolase 53 family protein [Bacillus sp. SD088]